MSRADNGNAMWFEECGARQRTASTHGDGSARGGGACKNKPRMGHALPDKANSRRCRALRARALSQGRARAQASDPDRLLTSLHLHDMCSSRITGLQEGDGRVISKRRPDRLRRKRPTNTSGGHRARDNPRVKGVENVRQLSHDADGRCRIGDRGTRSQPRLKGGGRPARSKAPR